VAQTGAQPIGLAVVHDIGGIPQTLRDQHALRPASTRALEEEGTRRLVVLFPVSPSMMP
jgi:hypothetical protein